MTREEHLRFCSICVNREFNTRRGIVCSLTSDIAAFEDNCESFINDDSVVRAAPDDSEVITAGKLKSRLPVEEYQKLVAEQNYPAAFLSGAVSGLVGAILWALITVLLEIQFGIMAVGVGILVGLAMRKFGKGIENKFGITGAVFAFLACLLGNLLSITVLLANYHDISFVEVITKVGINQILSLHVGNIGVMGMLFYLLAIYVGFRLSVRKITDKTIEEINSGYYLERNKRR